MSWAHTPVHLGGPTRSSISRWHYDKPLHHTKVKILRSLSLACTNSVFILSLFRYLLLQSSLFWFLALCSGTVPLKRETLSPINHRLRVPSLSHGSKELWHAHRHRKLWRYSILPGETARENQACTVGDSWPIEAVSSSSGVMDSVI